MENLTRTLNIALLEENEADVTGLVFAILGESGKDYRNGYIVRAEHHTHGRTPADVTVEVLRDRTKILVIECKRVVGYFQKGEKQLEGHMVNGGYPNGLLICGQISRFYKYDPDGEDTTPVEDGQYNNALEIDQVIQRVREM